MDKRINNILSVSLFLSGLIAFPVLIYAIRISFYYSGQTQYTSIILPFVIIIGFILGLKYWGRKSDTTNDRLRLYIISQFGFLIWWIFFEKILSLSKPIYSYLGQAAFMESPGLNILKIIWISLIIIPFCFFMSSNIIIFTRYVMKFEEDIKKVIIKSICFYFFSSCLGLLIFAFLAGTYYFTYKLYFIITSLLYIIIIIGLALLRSTWAHPAIIKREFNERDAILASRQVFSPTQKKMILFSSLMLGWVLGVCLILWQKLFSIVLFPNQVSFVVVNIVFLLSLGTGCIFNLKGSSKIQSALPEWGITAFISSLYFMLSLILYPRLPYWIEHINHWFYHTRITFYFINAFIFFLISFFIIPPVSLLISGFIKTVDLITTDLKSMGASLSKMINFLLWGSMAGIFLTQILVVPGWGIKKAFFLNVILSFVFGVLLLFIFPVWKKRYKTLLSFLVLTMIIVFLYLRSPWVPLGLWSTNIHSQWQPIKYGDFISSKEKRNIVFYKDDIIQNYMLIGNENKKESGEYELFINGIKQINFSNKNLSSSPVLLSTIPNMLIESNNTLVLGDRSGLIEYCMSHISSRNVDFVSPYGSVFQKTSKITNLSLNASQSKFNHYNEDELTFLIWNRNKYDIIIMDSKVIWQLGQDRFYSREFYKEASKHMNEKGLLAQVISSRWIDSRIFEIILTNAINEFPYIYVWGLDKTELMLLLSKRKINFDRKFLEKKFQETGITEILSKINIKYPFTVLAAQILSDQDVSDFQRVGSDRITEMDLSVLSTKVYYRQYGFSELYEKDSRMKGLSKSRLFMKDFLNCKLPNNKELQDFYNFYNSCYDNNELYRSLLLRISLIDPQNAEIRYSIAMDSQMGLLMYRYSELKDLKNMLGGDVVFREELDTKEKYLSKLMGTFFWPDEETIVNIPTTSLP